MRIGTRERPRPVGQAALLGDAVPKSASKSREAFARKVRQRRVGDGIATDLAPGGDRHAVLARAGPSAIVVIMLIPGRQQQDIKFTDCEQRNEPSLAEWDDELSKLPLLLASTACVRRK